MWNSDDYVFRFAYDGEWKFADLLTMTAGKLAVKFVVDSVTGKEYSAEKIFIKFIIYH